ncbi:hypothetical protein M8C21_023703 [Ambrosia artemisiifolia]|uniref:Uncharacterized protein n=1 Tax=Ambrosia artemisiifolia TaxID=4212 RepID=A0AAD5C8V0_AMBAR|nr:hypothetical protein M8C21_023703 [Ambrosia artemisiifolia]
MGKLLTQHGGSMMISVNIFGLYYGYFYLVHFYFGGVMGAQA